MKGDYWDIINHDLPRAEQNACQIAKQNSEVTSLGFESLLHPTILEKAVPLYAGGHYRQCILEAYITVFTFLRNRTGLDLDGDNLVGKALSLANPLLAFGDLTTETGKNAQKGMIQLLQGAYQAFRNTAAHPHNLTASQKAASQHLVFSSLLARRIEEAKKV